MLISTASIVVKSTRNRKNVRATDPDVTFETDADTGNMSCIVHGCRPNSATSQPLSLAIYASGTSTMAAMWRYLCFKKSVR